MSHPLVLGLFATSSAAALATRELHVAGVSRDVISIVARSHDEQVALARDLDATAGVEIEDSRAAARLGELSAVVIAAAAVGMPGVAPLLAAGPLAAELGEAAGHLAGSLSRLLTRAGVRADRASAWQASVARGHVLVGVHTTDGEAPRVRDILLGHGAEVALARWDADLP